MTERPVTRIELLFLSLGVGLFCGLILLTGSRPRAEQAKDRGHGDTKEFLAPATQFRAPLSQQWYGLPRYSDAAFPEGEAQEKRLY